MRRILLCGLILLLVCLVAWASFAEGEFAGKWSARGTNAYGVDGMSILSLALTWQAGFYHAALTGFALLGTVGYEATGIAYAVRDVLVCLLQEPESVRMDILLFESETGTLVWQWSTVGHEGEYTEETLRLTPYEWIGDSEDS